MLQLQGESKETKEANNFFYFCIDSCVYMCVLTVGGDGNKRLRRVRCARAPMAVCWLLVALCCSVFSVSKNRSSSYDVCIIKRGRFKRAKYNNFFWFSCILIYFVFLYFFSLFFVFGSLLFVSVHKKSEMRFSVPTRNGNQS